MGGEFLIFCLKVIEFFPAVLSVCRSVFSKPPPAFFGVVASLGEHVSLGCQVPGLMEAVSRTMGALSM